MKRIIIAFTILLLLARCSENDKHITDIDANQEESQYVLPYPVGKTYMCWQGRFTGGHNRWNLQYAQDFEMELGSVVTAAREGRVYLLDESVPENTGDDNIVNFVIILHEDNTYSRYVHLGENKIIVNVNQLVSKGDTLAFTGNTGNTGGVPHLHFDVIESVQGVESQTLPIWFKNTKSHPDGVLTGEYYKAETY